MKAHFQTRNGITFELDGADAKELFRQIAALQEVFDAESKCGVCQSERLEFHFRNNNPEKYEYYEIGCIDCGARFQFGQKKQGAALFPKRRDKDGNELPNGGWSKYEPQDDEDDRTAPRRDPRPADEGALDFSKWHTPQGLQPSFDRLAERYSLKAIPVTLPGALAAFREMFRKIAGEHIFAAKARGYALGADFGTTPAAKLLLKDLVEAYDAVTHDGKGRAA